MPDVGVVNATGVLRKVELGTAVPPFQWVKSHASSTILIDSLGDFYGLGANPEGQLGDWTKILDASAKINNGSSNNETATTANSSSSTSKSEIALREKEINFFGKEIVEKVEKEIAEQKEKEKIVKPEGFGIVFEVNHDAPSVLDPSHPSNLASREMPMLAVEVLRKIEGMERVKSINNNVLNTLQQTEKDDMEEDEEDDDEEITVRYDSKIKNTSSAVVSQWRDRLGFGNGFGVLLDPLDEYDVSKSAFSVCNFPPLRKKTKFSSISSSNNRRGDDPQAKQDEDEEAMKRKKKRKQALKFW